MPGAEPFAAPGGPTGVLCCHGFGGTPASLGALPERLADAGFSVEAPLLPGHGTTVDELAATGWSDWSDAVDGWLDRLSGRCDRVVVVGTSMGGTLALWLAARRREVAGVVAVNPLVTPPPEEAVDLLRATLDGGEAVVPAGPPDIADPDTPGDLAYDATPLAALLDLHRALGEEVLPRLGQVRCPVLVCTSRHDHVVDPAEGDVVASRVAGPVERLWLARSAHVAALDHDRELLAERAVKFALRIAT